MTRNASVRRHGPDQTDGVASPSQGGPDDAGDWAAAALAEQVARASARTRGRPEDRPSAPEGRPPAARLRERPAAPPPPPREPVGSGHDPDLERTQALVSASVGALGRKLAQAEGRFERAGSASLDHAFAALDRIENRLSAAIATPPEAPPIALRGPVAETAPRPSFRRRPLAGSASVREAVDEIRARRDELGASPPGARRAAQAAPVAPSSGPLPAAESDPLLSSLRADLTRLTDQIGSLQPAATREAEWLRREMEVLGTTLGSIATRQDLGRIERDVLALSEDIAELRQSGRSPIATAGEIEALHDEVKKLAAAPRSCEAEGLHRRIDAFADKLDDVAARGLSPDVTASLSRQVGELRQILDDAAAPRALSDLGRQLVDMKREIVEIAQGQIKSDDFTSLRHAVDDLRSSFASDRRRSETEDPRALSSMGGQLTELRRELEQLANRQIDQREFSSLQTAVEDVRTTLSRPAAAAARNARAGDSEGLETMLSTLVDKLDRVERKVADPDALDQLERQVEGLALRLGSAGGRGGDLSGIERTLHDVLGELGQFRTGIADVAQHAARAAVAETLGTMPRPADVAAHLGEIRAQYEVADSRTQRSLQNVNRTLEDVARRIASLEGEMSVSRRVLPAEIRSAAPEAEAPRRVGSRAPQVPVPESVDVADRHPRGRREPSLGGDALADADAPLAPAEEILLEPGAARPVAPGARSAPAEPADIKSSFIAAARRAAQAAAQETGREARAAPVSAVQTGEAGPSRLAGRLRAMLTRRRRPLLIGAAALVLALGALQGLRQFTGRTSGPPVRTEAAMPSPEGSASRPGLPDPATTQAAPAPVVRLADASAEVAPAAAQPRSVQAVAPGPAVAAPAPVATARAPEADPNLLPTGLKAAAAAGNPVALYELGTRTSEGRGAARDPKAAATLFEKAAEKGLPPAQYRIGNIHEKGIGVPRDLDQAQAWYRRAAENGNVRAMHNLAVLIAEGGGKPDYPTAVSWFQKAADHGVRDSQFNLAVLYARGLGVTQDLVRSYQWLAAAALQGDEDAGRKRDEVGSRLSAADLARAKAFVDRWRATTPKPEANEVAVPPGGWPESAQAAPPAGASPVKRASR